MQLNFHCDLDHMVGCDRAELFTWSSASTSKDGVGIAGSGTIPIRIERKYENGEVDESSQDRP